jgi:hypothetical protein
MLPITIALALTLATPPPSLLEEWAPVTLRGSPEAMAEQNRVAREHDLQFFRTAAEIEEAVARGDLVYMPGDENYAVADFVVPPYIHPEVLTFIERTTRLYHEACGERLVVTSGVRAIRDQPPNAHPLSVHPTGIAVDFRVSQREECRQWFEQKMLELEGLNVLNVTREFRPPHYHVAVYPEPYAEYRLANPLPEPPPQQPDPVLIAGEEEREEPAAGWFVMAAVAAVLLMIGVGYVLRRRSATAEVVDPEVGDESARRDDSGRGVEPD